MIVQKPSPNFKVGRQGYKPEIIVLHISSGSLASCISWFQNPASQVSAHYIVGLDGSVVQFVKDEDTSWAQGKVSAPTFKLYKQGVNPNAYCLSIENEGQDLSRAREAQLNALVGLIASLGAKWNIPLDRNHIIGHYEINSATRPNCPATDKSIIDKIVARLQPIETIEQKKARIIKLIQEL